ncbi:unnamed protein product, partial [Timema podura]|nr:unnamed protein product [Timema podura]
VKWAHLLQSSQKTICAKWNTDHIEDSDDYSYSWAIKFNWLPAKTGSQNILMLCRGHYYFWRSVHDSKENFKPTQNLPAGFIDIDEESDSEEEGSDTMEHRDEVYDPMDPLN